MTDAPCARPRRRRRRGAVGATGRTSDVAARRRPPARPAAGRAPTDLPNPSRSPRPTSHRRTPRTTLTTIVTPLTLVYKRLLPPGRGILLGSRHAGAGRRRQRGQGDPMRLWWEVARRGFRRYATYRWATFAGVFTNTSSGSSAPTSSSRCSRSSDASGGYDLPGRADVHVRVPGPAHAAVPLGLAGDRRHGHSGQIATDLYRPFDYQLYWLSQDLGRATYHALMRGIPPFVVGALFFDLRLPTHPVTWLAFVVSCRARRERVSFALRFMVNSAAVLARRRPRRATRSRPARGRCCPASSIPIAFFPDALRGVVRVLPFVAMLELPMDVFLERVHGARRCAHAGRAGGVGGRPARCRTRDARGRLRGSWWCKVASVASRAIYGRLATVARPCAVRSTGCRSRFSSSGRSCSRSSTSS